jgi:transposase
MDRTFAARQVAAHYGVHLGTVRRWTSKRLLDSIRVGGG